MVSGSYDTTIKVWDLKDGECLKTLHGHQGPVLCMQFDQRHLITGGGDSLIKVEHNESFSHARKSETDRNNYIIMSARNEVFNAFYIY